MKRYAIVRVDNKCPDEFEKIDVQFICRNLSCYEGKECYKNFYGDTKEQLVKKVAQALVRARIEEDENSKSLSWEQIATRVVEFLGVEE